MARRMALATICIWQWAATAAAEEVSYFAGVALTSNYVSNGVTQTRDGAAIQPYLEASKGGFYAGIWASNVDFGTADTAEIDLYLGYRTSLFDDVLGLDIGYARYFYNASGDCCGEVKLSALVRLAPGFGVEGYLAYDPEFDVLNRRGTLAYEVNDALALSASWGTRGAGFSDYWDVGGSYAFNETVSIDARYLGSEAGDPGLVVTLSLATAQGTLRRLFGVRSAQR